MRLFCVWAFLSCAAMARDVVIYAPASESGSQGAIFQNHLTFARPSLALHGGAAAPSALGSSATVTAEIPLFWGAGSVESAGWGAGVAAGYRPEVNEVQRLFVPEQFFYEVALGRGTTVYQGGRDTGLRGYFEVLFRDVRLLNADQAMLQAAALGQSLRSSMMSAGLRIGATHGFAGKGLPRQPAPRLLAFAFQLTYLFPMSEQGDLLSLRGALLSSLISERWPIGLDFQWWKHSAQLRTDLSEDFDHIFAVGPMLQFRLAERWAFDVRARWTLALSQHRESLSPWPALALSASVAL